MTHTLVVVKARLGYKWRITHAEGDDIPVSSPSYWALTVHAAVRRGRRTVARQRRVGEPPVVHVETHDP